MRLPPHPDPLPLRGGEGVRWRRWFRCGKHLAVRRLAPQSERTVGERFPLSPSEGERAGPSPRRSGFGRAGGVRGQAVRLA